MSCWKRIHPFNDMEGQDLSGKVPCPELFYSLKTVRPKTTRPLIREIMQAREIREVGHRTELIDG